MKPYSINKVLETFYDQYYDGESYWRELCAKDKVNNIVKLCHNIKHNKILEIGCGEGSIIQCLSSLNFAKEIYALEVSMSAINAVSKRKIKNLTECSLYDGYNISYNDKQFDLAILSHVVEHLEYPRKLLYEASRVAKHVFIEVPLELHLRTQKNIYKKNVTAQLFDKRSIIPE